MQSRADKRRLTDLMSISSSPYLDNTEKQAKTYVNIFRDIYKLFREDDANVLATLKDAANIESLKEVLIEYRCRSDLISEAQLIVYFNCFTKRQIREEFGRFLWDFDENYDGRIQQEEFEKCLELMASKNRIGKSKVRLVLKAMGVEVDEGVGFLKEGLDKEKVVDKQISGQLREMFTARNQTTGQKLFKKASKKLRLNYMEVGVILPYLFSMWFEYELKLALRHRLNYQQVMGVQFKYEEDGSYSYDPFGLPSGMYLSVCRVMNRRVPLDEPCITYRIVVRALMNFQGSNIAVRL